MAAAALVMDYTYHYQQYRSSQAQCKPHLEASMAWIAMEDQISVCEKGKGGMKERGRKGGRRENYMHAREGRKVPSEHRDEDRKEVGSLVPCVALEEQLPPAVHRSLTPPRPIGGFRHA